MAASDTAQTSILKVISHGKFRALWLGQILSQVATNSLIFVLALQLFQSTGSNTAVSFLFFVYGIPAVLFGMAAGTIVDKLEKRQVLLFCNVSRAVLVMGFAFFGENIFLIYFLTFINAIITQFYVPAEAPTIPHLVDRSELVTANSLFSLTYFSSLAVGSVFAGPFLRAFGPFWVFLILAILYVSSGLVMLEIPKVGGTSKLRVINIRDVSYYWKRLLANLQEGLSYVRHSRVLSEALFLLLGTQVILAILGTLGPGFAVRVMDLPVNDASVYIMGPAVLGILLGALWVGNIGYRMPKKKLMQIGIMSAGIILVVISVTVRMSRVPFFERIFTRSFVLPMEFLLFFLLGVSNSLLDVPANSVLQEHSEGEMRGRIYGMLTAGVGGVGVLPVVAGGILADVIGVGKVIFLLGLAVVGYGIWRVKYSTTT